MAKLREIFTNEDMAASEKVGAIASIVEKARENYGNSDMDITIPEVSTCEGITDLSLMSDDDKVAIAERSVSNIIQTAVEFTKEEEGIVLDKEIERLVATNPVLVNLSEAVDSEYI